MVDIGLTLISGGGGLIGVNCDVYMDSLFRLLVELMIL